MRTKQTLGGPANLLAWRTGRKLNQRAAARLLGVTQGYYSKLENQSAMPSRDVAKRLTEKTGVPLTTIMGIAS